MRITFDPAKRDRTLAERGVEFEDAIRIFAGLERTFEDDRKDYGERRWITIGYLDTRMVVVVWTARNSARHIISMRKANDREQRQYQGRLGRS